MAFNPVPASLESSFKTVFRPEVINLKSKIYRSFMKFWDPINKRQVFIVRSFVIISF